jgi:hypothetical protein
MMKFTELINKCPSYMKPKYSLPFTKDLTLQLIMNQLNLVYTFTFFSLKIFVNIILPFLFKSPNWSLSSRISNHKFLYIPHFPHV